MLCVQPHIRAYLLALILLASRLSNFSAEHEHVNRVPAANSLLAGLPRNEWRRLLTGLEPVTLTFGEVLYEPGRPIRHVYFPSDSLVSLLTLVEGHRALEIGLVGREGVLGIPVALGITRSPVRAAILLRSRQPAPPGPEQLACRPPRRSGP